MLGARWLTETVSRPDDCVHSRDLTRPLLREDSLHEASRHERCSVPRRTVSSSHEGQHAHLLMALMPRPETQAPRKSLRYAAGRLAAAMRRQQSLPTSQAPLSLCALVQPLTRHPEAHQAPMSTMPQVREASRLQEAAGAVRPRAELRCRRRPTWGHRPMMTGAGGLGGSSRCLTAFQRRGAERSCQDERVQRCRDSKRSDYNYAAVAAIVALRSV